MSISEPNNLTKFFLEPANSTYRQYEALRQGNRIKISHLAPQQVGKLFSAPTRFQSLVFDP